MNNVEWVKDTVFEKDGIVIQVNRLPFRKPKFSMKIGRHGREEGQITPFVPVETTGQGKLAVVPVADTILELVKQAEDYIEKEAQIAEDMYLGDAQSREQRDLDRGKPKLHHGLSGQHSGKTARDREKRRNR